MSQGRPFGLLQDPGERRPHPGTADGCQLLAILPPLSSDVVFAAPHAVSFPY